ncbi:MAG: hypothetical protein ACH350_01215 [Parachlamydiaceae bacterium]
MSINSKVFNIEYGYQLNSVFELEFSSENKENIRASDVALSHHDPFSPFDKLETSAQRKKISSQSSDFPPRDDQIVQVDQVVEVDQENIEKEINEAGEEEGRQRPLVVYSLPDKWYPLIKNQHHLIDVASPVEIIHLRNVIYIFKNNTKNAAFIGSTHDFLYTKIFSFINKKNKSKLDNKLNSVSEQFFSKLRQYFHLFEMGILYQGSPSENLADLEAQFIDYWRGRCKLYQDGEPIEEEKKGDSLIYAIPKPGNGPFTPDRRYPFVYFNNKITIKFTPGFEKKVKQLREGQSEPRGFLYSIKKSDTKECSHTKEYIGLSFNPSTRLKQHAYQASKNLLTDPNDNPDLKTGSLYQEIANQPEAFTCGLIPLCLPHEIDPEKKDQYVLLEGIDDAERYVIREKRTLVSQEGYNRNAGGGGVKNKRRKTIASNG